MKSWYIIAAFKVEDLTRLLDIMDIEYLNPVCVRTTVARQKLRVRPYNLLGGYVFARIDVVNQYYELLHNELFYNNVIDILRIGDDFISAESQIKQWRHIADAIALPLRLYSQNGRYVISTDVLRPSEAVLIHYYRRKYKATIEICISEKWHRLSSLAAYDVGNESPPARELDNIYSIMAKSREQFNGLNGETSLINYAINKMKFQD